MKLYRVEQHGGELVRAIAGLDELVPGIVSLGQACVRTADLMFTKRSAMVTAFSEQVEEVLSDARRGDRDLSALVRPRHACQERATHHTAR